MTRRLPIVLALLATLVIAAPRPSAQAPRTNAASNPERTTGAPSGTSGVSGAPSPLPSTGGTNDAAGEAVSPAAPTPHPTAMTIDPATGTNPDLTQPPTDPTAKPSPAARFSVGRSLAGQATWYQYHPGQAAAARALRDHLGAAWRGAAVTVTGPAGQVTVRLTDYESSTIPGRLIDLDGSDFTHVCGALSLGVCTVSVAP